MWTAFYLLCVGTAVVRGLPMPSSTHEPISTTTHNINGKLAGAFANTSAVVHSIHSFIGHFNISCDVCKVTVQHLQDFVNKGSTQEEIVKAATTICNFFKIQDEVVCYGISRMLQDEVIYVLTHLVLRPDEICGLVLGDSCAVPYNPLKPWNVTFPDTPKPPVDLPVPPKDGSPTIRILHLTDFHFDPMYQEGANAECGEPLCCRQSNGLPNNASEGAGKWGDYRNCDLPPRTLVNLFEHLKANKGKFDVIYFTGDIPPHNIWNQSRSDELSALEFGTKLFREYLPGVPVYSAVGNHESTPVNSFPPPFVTGKNNISWLYSALDASWSYWLPGNTTETILKGAYYTVSPFPGFRIVSLNMNYCQNLNWWLFVNMTDPAGQLEWLISVLQDAENAEEKVHILGHIPPIGCMKSFSWNYYQIINRYESTIVGQFFGHDHGESFNIFYDEQNFTRPLGVLYQPGSVTTYTNYNPGYRIYEVDGHYANSSHYPLRYQNYILNISDANLSDNPQWSFEYDTQADLGMTSIYPHDWHNFVYRMKSNETLFQKYYRYMSKSVDQGPCTGSCKSETLCVLKTARSRETNTDICKDL